MTMTSKVFRAALQLGLLAVLLVGCGDSGGDTEPKDRGLTYCDNLDAPTPVCLDPSFEADLSSRLESCTNAGCHGTTGGVTTWAIDLSNGPESALADLIDVQSQFGTGALIDPDNIDCSHMLSKLTAADADLVAGEVMPTGAPWTAGETDCFRKFLHDYFAN